MFLLSKQRVGFLNFCQCDYSKQSYFTWFLPHQEQGIFFLCLLFFFAEFFLCSSLQWCHINPQYSLPWIFTYWSQRQCNLLFVRLSLFPLLPSHASSSYFDLKDSCSRSRAISLAIYTILFQSLKHVRGKIPFHDWRWYTLLLFPLSSNITFFLNPFFLPRSVTFSQCQLHLWGFLCLW